MRKIVLGNFKHDKRFKKQLHRAHRDASKILRRNFGDVKGYDLIFTRSAWTYSSDDIDFYNRNNHTAFEVDERFILKNVNIRNNIIRALSSYHLRKLKFDNEFLMDILAIGAGFYLSRLRKKLDFKPEYRAEFEKMLKSGKLDFERWMDGGEVPENFFGFWAEGIVAEIAKVKKIAEITEVELRRIVEERLRS